jgi:hypothetical protein
MPSCSTLTTAFPIAIACAAAVQAAAVLAWRQRRPDLSRWRLLTDPTCLFRTSYYKQASPARFLAIGIQSAGALVLAWRVFQLITAQQNGVTQVCGLSF